MLLRAGRGAEPGVGGPAEHGHGDGAGVLRPGVLLQTPHRPRPRQHPRPGLQDHADTGQVCGRLY